MGNNMRVMGVHSNNTGNAIRAQRNETGYRNTLPGTVPEPMLDDGLKLKIGEGIEKMELVR
jgi:hypothetical protein